jgi:hypothetical protein
VEFSYYDGSLDEDDLSVEELDGDDSSSVEEGNAGQKVTPWKCIKCNCVNTTSACKCYACNAWKDGKRPTKKASGAKTAAELPPILQKSQYKPLFEVNDPVYAPWFQDHDSRSNQTWHPGVITGYVTVKNGVYGPVRKYKVSFDDGDQLLNHMHSQCCCRNHCQRVVLAIYFHELYHLQCVGASTFNKEKEVMSMGCNRNHLIHICSYLPIIHASCGAYAMVVPDFLFIIYDT